MNGEFAHALAEAGIDTPVQASHPPGPYGEPKTHVMVYNLCIGGVAVNILHRRASLFWLAHRGSYVFAGGLDGLLVWLKGEGIYATGDG